MNLFYKESKSNKKISIFSLFFFGGGGGGGGRMGEGARVSDFIYKESKSKKNFFFFWVGEG